MLPSFDKHLHVYKDCVVACLLGSLGAPDDQGKLTLEGSKIVNCTRFWQPYRLQERYKLADKPVHGHSHQEGFVSWVSTSEHQELGITQGPADVPLQTLHSLCKAYAQSVVCTGDHRHTPGRLLGLPPRTDGWRAHAVPVIGQSLTGRLLTPTCRAFLSHGHVQTHPEVVPGQHQMFTE